MPEQPSDPPSPATTRVRPILSPDKTSMRSCVIPDSRIAHRMAAAQRALEPYSETVLSFALGEPPSVADFLSGDPHQPPPEGFVAAIRRHAVPAADDWYAYRFVHEPAREAVAASLNTEPRTDPGPGFDAQDVFPTRGAAGAIELALTTIVDPGDEVVYLSPPWFFYEPMILAAGARPVPVPVTPPDFDLDVEAVVGAITPRTRAVLINTPHNPTGRIFPPEVLRRLGERLTEAAERHDRPIWLISDEAYNRILFDDNVFTSPATSYPYTMACRSYSKSALAPGQRLGFLVLSPGLPAPEGVRSALLRGLLSGGLNVPDAVMQYAMPDIDALVTDVPAIQRRRDHMVDALRSFGYRVHNPEATFYLLPVSPIADDRAFCALLADRGIGALPGEVIELPGYFRLCMTATDDMVNRSLPIFERVLNEI